MTNYPITHFHVHHALTNPQHFADLQGCRDLERIKGIDEPILSMQERTQMRAKEFFSVLEKNLGIKEEDVSPLRSLLQRTLQIPDTEENAPVFATITKAFFKQKGYFPRLFSGESWEQWAENRTPLGKVTSQFRDCMESSTQASKFVQSLDKRELQQANKEAKALLNTLDLSKITSMKTGLSWKDFNFLSKSSCTKGLISGTATSFALKNPLPLLLGLSQCLPNVHAQRKIGSYFQANAPPNLATASSVVGLKNGNFVVAWQSLDKNTFSSLGIFSQLFDANGIKIGSEFQVNAYTGAGDHRRGAPSIATLSNDNFVVAWHSDLQDRSGFGIYGQLFYENTIKIGSEFRINTYTTSSQINPSVASLKNGNFVVTWQSFLQDGSDMGIFGQLFNANSSKIGNEFQVNTYINGTQEKASVASLLDNNFVVTWISEDQDGNFTGVFGQLFNANTSKMVNEFLVNNYTISRQEHPSVASLRNGNFIAIWMSFGQDLFNWGIFGQLFNANASKIGSEFQVNTYGNSVEANPSVGDLSTGHFVVTWSRWPSGNPSCIWIFGQLFDENANKIGNEFQVSTYDRRDGNTCGDQLSSSIGNLGNGNFVVTWDNYLFFNTLGQIFNESRPVATHTATTSASTKPSTNQSTTTNLSSKQPTNPISGSSRETISASTYLTSSIAWLWLMSRGQRV